MSPAELLVEQLAQVEIEAHFGDPQKLAAAMAERQGILTSLRNTDTSSLDDEQRARFKERLRALLERDQQVLLSAEKHLEETRKSMQQLVPARAAVRGYIEARSEHPAPLRRIG
jgi:Flagellar protein FliT